MKKERLVLMKLINRHWMLRNQKTFDEMHPLIHRTSSAGPIELVQKEREYYDSLEKEREELQRKFLVLNSKKGDEQ